MGSCLLVSKLVFNDIASYCNWMNFLPIGQVVIELQCFSSNAT